MIGITGGPSRGIPLSRGMPKFSGRNTFLVPDKSSVLIGHGLGGDPQNVQDLIDNLAESGDLASVCALPNRGVKTVDRLQICADEQAVQIDKLRALRTRKNVDGVYARLASAGNRQSQLKAIRESFDLEAGNPLAQAVAEVTLNLFTASDFPRQMLGQCGPGTSLQAVVRKARNYLAEEIKNQGLDLETLDSETLDKTVNGIMDAIAPRFVVLGHSLGGNLATRTLLDNNGNVGMVLTMHSPINGNHGGWLSRLLGLRHAGFYDLAPESGAINDLQESPLPFDTTHISLADPLDNVVPEKATRHRNLTKPGKERLSRGRLHLLVPSRKGSYENLMNAFKNPPLLTKPVQELLQWTLSETVGKTKFIERSRYHLGLVDRENFNFYWSDEEGALKKLIYGDPVDDESGALLNEPATLSNLERLLDRQNYEPMRLEILEELRARTDKDHANSARYRKKYAPLKTTLKAIAAAPTPFKNGSDKRAQRVLDNLAFSK